MSALEKPLVGCTVPLASGLSGLVCNYSLALASEIHAHAWQYTVRTCVMNLVNHELINLMKGVSLQLYLNS